MSNIIPKLEYPLFIKSEIDASPGDDCILCLLNSKEVTILRQALFPVAYWRTRFGERGVGKSFIFSEDEDDKTDFRQLIDEIDYKLSGGFMTTCFEDVKIGLEAIAAALEAIATKTGVCCSEDANSVVVNVTPEGQIVTGVDVGTGPGETEGQGEPPAGYSSWEDYFIGKCNASYFIANGVIALLRMFAANSGAMTAVILGGMIAGVLTLQVEVVALAALVAVLVFVEGTVLSELADGLESRKDDIVCALYKSKTVGEAIDGVMVQADAEIIALSVLAPIGAGLKTVLVTLFSNAASAKLFSLVGSFMTAQNCDNCDAQAFEWHFDGSTDGFTQSPAIEGGGGITSSNSLLVPSITSFPGSYSGIFQDNWVPATNMAVVLKKGNWSYELVSTNTDYWTGAFKLWILSGSTYTEKLAIQPAGLGQVSTGVFNVAEDNAHPVLGMYCGNPSSTYWTRIDRLKLMFAP